MHKKFLTICLLALSFNAVAEEVITDTLDLEGGLYSSPEKLLQGKLSGLRVGSVDGNAAGEMLVNIRGINSQFLSGNPLWIIDGTVLSDASAQSLDMYDNGIYGRFNYTARTTALDFVNLYDIESIEVIKNISEAARYGSSGANGVILINTKGASTKKPFVSWHSNVGFVPGSSAISHNHDLSVGLRMQRSDLRMSAFYKDFQNNGSDRAGGLRARFDMRSNQIIQCGFNSSVVFSTQDMLSAAANYGVPSMGLALAGVSIPGQINTVDSWTSGHDDYSDNFRGVGNMYLQVNFLPSLSWKSDVTFDFNNVGRYSWYGKQTQFGSEFENAAAIDIAKLFRYNAQTRLSYDGYIGSLHRLTAGLHLQYQGDVNKYNIMTGDHFLTDLLRTKGFSLRESASTPHHISKQYNSLGGDVEFSYTFGSFVGISAIARADKSLTYDTDFTLYPSARLWLDLQQMLFPEGKAISGLKLQGGWGKAGYDRYVPYQLSGRLIGKDKISTALDDNKLTVNSSDPKYTLGNYFDGYDRIRSAEWNVSLSSSFVSNRINLDLGWYSKATDEAFTMYCFGKPKSEENFVWRKTEMWELLSEGTSFYNRGLEATLSAALIKAENIGWNLSMNVTTNENDIRYYVGESLDGFCPAPKVFGGLATNLTLCGFTLDLNFTGAAGFDVYNFNSMLESQGAASFSGFSSDYVEKGDYLRLSRAAISYSFDMSGVKWIRSLKLSLTGSDLFTVTGYDGVNPDVNSFGGVAGKYSGMDYGTLPLVRTIMLGVKAEF